MKPSGQFRFVLVAVLVTSCSGKAPLPPPAPAPTPAPTQPSEPVGSVREEPPVKGPELIRERSKDAPELGLKVHFSGPRQVYRGWPLLVDVGVSHPDAWMAAHEERSPVPLKLIPASGGWDSLVKVRFIGPDKSEVSLPLVPMFHPEGALVMDAQAPSYVLRWHLGPDATRALVPGPYIALAQLNVPSGSQQGGWTGRVDALPIRFEVVDEPTPLSSEQSENKAVSFAQYEVYRGNPSAALATLEAHVAVAPDSPGALSAQAELLENMGELERAYAVYGQALQALQRKYPGRQQEAPFGILTRRRALRERLYPLPAP